MEMSIDEARQLLSHYQKLFNSLNGAYRLSQVQASELRHSIGTALDIMRRYQMMELDRKSEMVAMLEELALKLYEQYDDTDLIKVKYIRQAIQQKIDKLRGEQA